MSVRCLKQCRTGDILIVCGKSYFITGGWPVYENLAPGYESRLPLVEVKLDSNYRVISQKEIGTFIRYADHKCVDRIIKATKCT